MSSIAKILPSVMLGRTSRLCLDAVKSLPGRQGYFQKFGPPAARCCSVLSGKSESTSDLASQTGKVQVSHPHLKIESPSLPRPLTCHLFWLRDLCRCPKCYDTATRQKKVDLMSMPWDIRVDQCSLRDGKLDVTWQDGHSSVFELDGLRTHSEGKIPEMKISRKLWGSEMSQKLDLVTVPHKFYMKEDDGLRQLVKNLLEYGMAIVSEVPPTSEATQEVTKRVGPNLPTFYGDFWDLGSLDAHQDVGYSLGPLSAHTDHTYFGEPAGMIVLHCVNRKGTGGESLLVDGFKVAEVFRRQNPEGYEVLSRTAVPIKYVEEGQCHISHEPIFNHNKVTGELEQIRMNMYDRKPPYGLHPWQQGAFYSHLRHLVSLIRDPGLETWTQLRPGSVIFIDNWRLMHGRAAYTGVRNLVGCYLSRTDYLNKARVLRLVQG